MLPPPPPGRRSARSTTRARTLELWVPAAPEQSAILAGRRKRLRVRPRGFAGALMLPACPAACFCRAFPQWVKDCMGGRAADRRPPPPRRGAVPPLA